MVIAEMRIRRPLILKRALGKESTNSVREMSITRASQIIVRCWQCGAVNYVEDDWSSFRCWNCGTVNYLK